MKILESYKVPCAKTWPSITKIHTNRVEIDLLNFFFVTFVFLCNNSDFEKELGLGSKKTNTLGSKSYPYTRCITLHRLLLNSLNRMAFLKQNNPVPGTIKLVFSFESSSNNVCINTSFKSNNSKYFDFFNRAKTLFTLGIGYLSFATNGFDHGLVHSSIISNFNNLSIFSFICPTFYWLIVSCQFCVNFMF